MRDIDQSWMSIKLGVVKAAEVSMTEINRMDIFDFFVMFHELEEKAERQKING